LRPWYLSPLQYAFMEPSLDGGGRDLQVFSCGGDGELLHGYMTPSNDLVVTWWFEWVNCAPNWMVGARQETWFWGSVFQEVCAHGNTLSPLKAGTFLLPVAIL